MDSLPLWKVGQRVWLRVELGSGTSVRVLVSWSCQLGPRSSLGGMGPASSARALVWSRPRGFECLRLNKLPVSRLGYLSTTGQFCEWDPCSGIPSTTQSLHGRKNHCWTTSYFTDFGQQDASARESLATRFHQRRLGSATQYAGRTTDRTGPRIPGIRYGAAR